MGVLSWLESKLFPRRSASVPWSRGHRDATPAPARDEFAWLHPPENLRDAIAWDTYHYQHLIHGVGLLTDMLCDDRQLVTAMHALQFRTVLCAGTGLSREPLALAAAGFHVAALDLSARALQVSAQVSHPPDYTSTFLDAHQLRPGGRVEWVAGDILDRACCPGPFDLIIERRTAQNYPQLADILTPLIGRLSPSGVFFTHCHDGAWRPPAEPQHRVGDWLKAQGWRFWTGSGPKPPGRVAWLYTTTG